MSEVTEAMIEAGSTALEDAENTPFLNPPNAELVRAIYLAMREAAPVDERAVERLIPVIREARFNSTVGVAYFDEYIARQVLAALAAGDDR